MKNIDISSVPAPFFHSYQFAPYRHYRMFSEAEMENLQRDALLHKELLGFYNEQRLTSLLAFQHLAWDSELLGYPCGRVKTFIGDSECDIQQVEDLFRHHLESLQEAYESLDLEVDCSDLVSLLAAQRVGFHILDTKLTYLVTCDRPFQRTGRPRFRIAPYEPSQRGALLALGKQAFPQMPGRFRADPDLGAGEPERLYLAWLEGALHRNSNYKIQLAWRGEELVGFLCYKSSPSVLEITGRHLYGRGLSGVLPSAMGAYVDLLCHSIEQDYRPGDGAEFETSLTNPQAFRVFEHLGFRLVRSTYVLKLAR